MGTRKLRHDAYTVGWVCVLDCELNAARALLDEEDEPLEPVLNDDSIYLLGRIGKHNVVITFSGIYGTNSTAQAVTNLVRTFPNIRFGLMVGVGGAVPGSPHPDNSTKDIRLGDVVVSEPKGNHGKCSAFLEGLRIL
jgi:nucleoside phosphorylase